MRLVLLRLSALGDILRVLPAWANLHSAFPDAHLQAVVEARHAFLLEPFPWLQPVVLDRRRLSAPWSALSEIRRVAASIAGADASLDFHGILKSALIPAFAGIQERWGDGATREFAETMQTHSLPFSRQSRYSQALGLAGAFAARHGGADCHGFHPALRSVQLPEPGPIWGTSGRPRVVLVPGASRRGAIKRWPMAHWIALARLLRHSCELRWSLGPEEVELRQWLPGETGVEPLPIASLWGLAGMLRQADRVVAGDTGLLHLAVVLGVPVVGVYGSSDPVVAGIPAGAGVILRTGIACSPCRERECRRRQCLSELEPSLVAAHIV